MAKRRSYTPILVLTGIGLGVGGLYLYDRSQKLSKNFHLKDVKRSATATSQGIKEQFVRLPAVIKKNARKLAKSTLQPIRNRVGAPIYITSWYRHPKTNVAVGGVSNSHHLTARAVDMYILLGDQVRNDLLAKAVINSQAPFTKMILEGGSDNNRPANIHLSYVPGDNSQVILRQTETGYFPLTRSEILNLG